jgi:uncharacterized protein
VIDEKDIRVRMRDGVHVALRIYRPGGTGPFPVLFAPAPYRYDNDDLPAYPMFLWRETGPIAWYVEHGYAYARMDVRGTGYSEGTYGLLGRDEQNDLYDRRDRTVVFLHVAVVDGNSQTTASRVPGRL